jgi:hypothetical protein
MLGLERAMAKMEVKFMETMNERMTIETVVCPETLTLTTYSWWDENLVTETEIDLTPLAEAIEARLKK